MSDIGIDATKREIIGKKVKQLRREGKVPAVIYGPEFDSTPITIDAREARSTLIEAGGTNVIDVNVDGEIVNVLVRDVQRDVLRDNILHIDFYRVDMNRLLRTDVPIAVINEPAIVLAREAQIVQALNMLTIEALPNDIPNQIEVDLSDKTEIGDQVLVEDLSLPEGVTVITPGEELIVKLDYAQQLAEEEPEEEDELILGTASAEPEVITERTEDEEE